MFDSVMHADTTDEILTAWIAKEELHTLPALARTGATRSVIAARLYSFYSRRSRSNVDELNTLATTIETWWPVILAFIDTGITNARTEGLNPLVKQSKRSARGYRNPTNGRRRRVCCMDR